MTMQPHMPEKFEEELSGHLSAQLEKHRGKAAAAFRAQLQGGDQPHRVTDWAPRRMDTRKLWTRAGIPSAVAASLAIMLTFSMSHDGKTGSVPPVTAGNGGVKQMASEVPESNQVVMTREVPDGTTVQDDVPMQVVRQQQLRQMQWFDRRDRATYQLSEPIEKVNYVRIQPY